MKKAFIIILALLLTFFLVRELLSYAMMSTDFATSIIPGWHTSIYPNQMMLSIGALLVICAAVIAYGIFRGIKRLLDRFIE